MVFLDPAGIPMKYDQLEIYKDAIGTAECRIAIDVPNKDSWQTSGLVVNTKDGRRLEAGYKPGCHAPARDNEDKRKRPSFGREALGAYASLWHRLSPLRGS